MDDGGVFNRIFTAATGVWAIFLALAVAIFKGWPAIMGRLNERRRDEATEKNSDWDRRTEEIERLHALLANREKLLSDRDVENDVLRQDRDEWKSRAVTSEATLLGLGNARQREAERIAKERETATQLAAPQNGGGK